LPYLINAEKGLFDNYFKRTKEEEEERLDSFPFSLILLFFKERKKEEAWPAPNRMPQDVHLT